MRRALIGMILASTFAWVKAQDAHFSQFYASPLYLAPSFTGTTEGTRINILYRNQWPLLPGIFETYAVSVDHYFYKFNSGVGALFSRDRAGTGSLGTTNAGLQYSYNVVLNRDWRLRPGIHIFYTQRSIDISSLTLPDQITSGGRSASVEIPPAERTFDLDFSTSILAHTDIHWVGFSVDHLTRPNQSLYGEESIIPIKYSFFGGTQIIKRGRLLRAMPESLSMSFLFKSQGGIHQLDLGAYWYRYPLMFGMWYRGVPFLNKLASRDAIVVLAGYKLEDFSIGYSYDITISRLLLSTGGSHEVSLIYKFNQEWEKLKKTNYKSVPCPEF